MEFVHSAVACIWISLASCVRITVHGVWAWDCTIFVYFFFSAT